MGMVKNALNLKPPADGLVMSLILVHIYLSIFANTRIHYCMCFGLMMYITNRTRSLAALKPIIDGRFSDMNPGATYSLFSTLLWKNMRRHTNLSDSSLPMPLSRIFLFCLT